MHSLTGYLLFASPHLPDPNFHRTVVLMLQHDDEGAFGVVLTRPLPSTVAEIWQALGIEHVEHAAPIYLGGPVTGPLMAIHTEPDCAEGTAIPGVYYATNKEHLNYLVQESSRPFRIFSGYSGWAGGQLEAEFSEGSWLSTPATHSDIFADADALWKAIASRINLEILLPEHGHRHIPPSADMN
jgi:putative transcriptional regulator